MNNILNSKANRRKLVTCILSFVFFLEGMMFFNHYSYAYHIDQARDDLEKLERILGEEKGTTNPLGASLLGIYEPEDEFSDIRLKNLTVKIVDSTEYAIENADDIRQVSKLKKAVDEITEVQEEQISAIHQAMDRIEAEDISHEVKTTYEKAVDLKAKVEQATATIQTAIDNHEDYIEIDIKTDKDESHGESGQDHNADQEHEEIYVPHDNPNIDRIMRQKIEDAKQREANRKRIRLIEEGRDAQKTQKQKNKLTKLNNQTNRSG